MNSLPDAGKAIRRTAREEVESMDCKQNQQQNRSNQSQQNNNQNNNRSNFDR